MTTLSSEFGKLARPTDVLRLPNDRANRWIFTPITWSEFSDDQRRRWREWFNWAIQPGGELWDEKTGRAVLNGMRLDDADLAGIRLVGADLTHCSMRGVNLVGADLSGATLIRAHLDNASLARTRLARADLSGAHLHGADFTSADLSEALLHQTDLAGVDLKNARLFGARITDPIWWVDMPRAKFGWNGVRTVLPKGLPEHPIQDIMGLPPLLRRRLADAQYLRDMYRRAGPFGRAVMWLWGMTCAYGQSVGRWTAATALLLIFFSILFTLVPFNFSIAGVDREQALGAVHRPDFFQALYFSISTMCTLGLGDVAPAAGIARVLVSLQEITGYIMLGGLLSIFSNKLARLS